MAREKMWPRGEDGPKEKMDPWGEDMLKKRWVEEKMCLYPLYKSLWMPVDVDSCK